MLPFSPLHITTALLEGLGSLSTQLIQGDKKTIELVTKLVDNSWFLCPTTPYITEEQFNDIKMHLKELLARCDTQSNEYKRFSYIIQYLWNYANPELNPFYYETISFGKRNVSIFAGNWNVTISNRIR